MNLLGRNIDFVQTLLDGIKVPNLLEIDKRHQGQELLEITRMGELDFILQHPDIAPLFPYETNCKSLVAIY